MTDDPRGAGGAAVLLAAVLVAGSAAGQTAEITPIPEIGAPNRAQSDMALSIDAMCPQLLGIAQAGAGLEGAAEELLGACSALAATAAVQLGEGDPDTQQFIAALNTVPGLEGVTFADIEAIASDFDIPVDPDVYNGIIQQISGEEFQNAQSQVAEIRTAAASAVAARLAALRAGATGFTVAGLEGAAPALGAAALAGGAPVRAGQAGGGELSEAFLGRFGGFASGRGTFGSKDPTSEADGYDFTAPGLTFGLDYRVADTVVVGGAFSYDMVAYDYDSSLNTASGQDLETDSYLFSLYATAALTDALFVEGIANAGFANHESTRRVVIPGLSNIVSAADGDAVTARADYDSTQYGFAIGGGYDIALGPATITPLARVEYTRAEIDGAREQGAGAFDLDISDQEIDSFTSQIGVQAGYPVSTGFGILQPYARAEWFHEFLNDNDGALVSYANDVTVNPETGRQFSSFTVTTEDVDRDYGRLSGGLTVTLPEGITGFVEGSATVGLDNFDIFTVEGGLRITF